MKHTSKLIGLGAVLAFSALPVQAQQAVGRWNLGEQDPGAVSGNPGDSPTIDAVGTNNLVVTAGTPYYTNNTLGGGSTLAMAFDGASCYQGSVIANGAGFDALYGSLDFNNFSLSCDVYMTAVGSGGFSFPVSMGANSGGVAPVEVGGKWYLIHKSVANSAAGPAVALNAWTHLDLVRKPFGASVLSVLYVNGTPAVTNTTIPRIPTDFLTIGANELANNVPGNVEGRFNGMVDNVVITNRSVSAPPNLTGIAVAPGTIYSGNSIILTANGVTGDSSGRTFLWRKGGLVVTNSGATARVTLANVAVANSGTYDVVLTNNFGAVTSAVVTVTVLDPSYSDGGDMVKLRMGDDDPSAVAGNLGNAETRDALTTNVLTAFGTPLYSANVPVGGSAFSMAFDGGSYYQSTSLAELYSNLDFNNFSLSCDVYVTALGSAGFSFPVSMGGNTGGGFAIVEISGNWYVIHQGKGSSVGLPVVLNTWTHLELQRRQFGTAVRSRLFINGVDSGAEFTTPPTLPIRPNLTVGANALANEAGGEGYFNGQIDNVVIHNYSIGAKPTLAAGLTVQPDNTLLTGESLILSAAAQGGSPLTYNWRKNGITFASTLGASAVAASTTVTNLTTTNSGNYDVVVTNLLGAVTSAVVKVTVLPPGTPRPAPLVQYRLGEDDPGAVAGGSGNAVTEPGIGSTVVLVGGPLLLAANGTPAYDANVPAGGSVLSMSFDGASFYEGTGDPWTAFYSTFDFDHFSLSCDVYMTALGAAGFSFPFSIGGTGTGLAAVEIGGKWVLIHNNVGYSPTGPDVALNTWTHLEVRRMNFGSGVESRLLINGEDLGLSFAGNLRSPANAFFVGANRVPSGPEGYFNGQVDNVALFSYTSPASSLSVQAVSGQVQVKSQGRAGASTTLWRTPSLSPAAWTVVTNGFADGTGVITLTDPAPSAAKSFYRTSAP
jgi:hypothetical protein